MMAFEVHLRRALPQLPHRAASLHHPEVALALAFQSPPLARLQEVRLLALLPLAAKEESH